MSTHTRSAQTKIDVISGYTGSNFADPSHEQILTGSTGHIDAVKIISIIKNFLPGLERIC